jgi:hypothetical protein
VVVATSQHVVAPYLFPRYYTDEWVTLVEPEHVKCVAELRSPKGEILKEFPLKNLMNHPTSDFSLLSFERPEDVQENGLASYLLDMEDEFEQGTEVQIVGHEVKEPAVRGFVSDSDSDGGGGDDEDHVDVQVYSPETDEDTRVAVPGTLDGVLALSNPSQKFLVPITGPLVDGYCGGPVLNKCSARVKGMIEGIIPENFDVEHLRGVGCYIPSDVIRDFVAEYDRELTELDSQPADEIAH